MRYDKSETDALGNTVRYSYTAEGWLSTITDAEGKVTKFTYDLTGSLISEDYAGELHRENSYNELGLLTTVTTEEGVTEYQYDEGGRLLSVTEPNGDTVSYTYDGYGNRLSMSYPDGKTVKYTYDEMNRLVSVKGADGVTTKYSYDTLGRRIATDGAKEDTEYSYDEMGNLISQSTSGAYELALEYSYDLSGRMTKESRTENGATLESSYVYDALGQLTEFTRSDGYAESYTYDGVGNMLSKTQNGTTTRYSYNAANQLISSAANGETTKYTYDANGNLIQKGNTRYTYNALNLLESWTDGEYGESYSYNAEGLLSSISSAEGTTNLTWDILMGEGVVISAETNGVETNYTYGLERISAQTGKTRTEYIYDGRGSVAAEVSYNNAWYTLGGILSSKEAISKSYTPFGEQIGEAGSGFGYNGEYYNAATGMVYLRARFYEPEMNRFSQKDVVRGSIVQPGSLNRYSYVQNDPVNFIDPSGQSLKSAASALVGALTGVAKSIVSGVSKAASSVAARVSTSAPATGTSRAYTPGPIQSTARNFNPNNIMQSTSQAIADARKAADYMNATAPGSPAARQATQAYQETVRLASMANSSNNTNIARQAYQTSQFSVNRVNNVATGRLPNTYMPYDSSGNATSYYNSSRQAGKTPSPDAPRVEDVSGDATYYCDREDTSSASALITGAASPSNWTFGIGADFAAAYGIRISGGAQLVFDSKGNVGIMYYGGLAAEHHQHQPHLLQP